MILKVAKLGAKVLRTPSREVDPKAIARGDYEPFLGISKTRCASTTAPASPLPQVFTPLRVFLYEVHPQTRQRKEKEIPLTALFNASYEGVGADARGRLGGMSLDSVPLGREVPRFETIRVKALDRSGKPVAFEASRLPCPSPSARDRPPGRLRLSRPDARHEVARVHRQVRIAGRATPTARCIESKRT